MTKIYFWPIALLSLGLPIHGGITVFLPDLARWWKEGLLVLMLVLLWPLVWRLVIEFASNIKKQGLTATLKPFLTQPLAWAIAFLVWSVLLVLVREDLHTTLVAFRYLGLGFFAFGLCWFWCKKVRQSGKNGEKMITKLLHIFCTFLILGTLISVLFGLWAQFLGGFKVVETFYASTISSWVPGQTLPLYHEAGGIIRMQGLASGPIEFAHLCLLSLVALFSLRHSWPKWSVFGAAMLLVIGIYFSASRAVELVLFLSLFILILKPLWPRVKPLATEENVLLSLLVLLVFLGGTKFALTTEWAKNDPWLNQAVDARGGTMDHFTRPVEAIKSGSQTLVLGQLGEWGPAARAKNLKTINDDKAPIAENVFADWWVQLGVIGFILGIGFLVACLYQSVCTQNVTGMALVASMFIPMNLATIFDMTPISLIFFIFLALLVASPATSK